jgi:hypothetical protein
MVNAASMAVKSRRIDGAAESEWHADAVTATAAELALIFSEGSTCTIGGCLSAHHRGRYKARSEGIGLRCNAESS